MASTNPPAKLARTTWSLVDRIDRMVIPFLRRVAVPVLRISLGVVFVWFGLLKIFEVSPVSELVARTVYWVDPDIIVPLLGVFEVTVGVLLLLGRALRLTLLLFVAQMVGTFLTFFVLPERHVPRRQPAAAHGRGRVRREEPRTDLGGDGRRDDGPPGEGRPPLRSGGDERRRVTSCRGPTGNGARGSSRRWLGSAATTERWSSSSSKVGWAASSNSSRAAVARAWSPCGQTSGRRRHMIR